jgi:hypothetical protein
MRELMISCCAPAVIAEKKNPCIFLPAFRHWLHLPPEDVQY